MIGHPFRPLYVPAARRPQSRDSGIVHSAQYIGRRGAASPSRATPHAVVVTSSPVLDRPPGLEQLLTSWSLVLTLTFPSGRDTDTGAVAPTG
jgi:hypothetical protein